MRLRGREKGGGGRGGGEGAIERASFDERDEGVEREREWGGCDRETNTAAMTASLDEKGRWGEGGDELMQQQCRHGIGLDNPNKHPCRCEQ